MSPGFAIATESDLAWESDFGKPNVPTSFLQTLDYISGPAWLFAPETDRHLTVVQCRMPNYESYERCAVRETIELIRWRGVDGPAH
jgi:hypothetical protein